MRKIILAGLIGLAAVAGCNDDNDNDDGGGGGPGPDTDATGVVQVGLTTDAVGAPDSASTPTVTYTDTAGNTLVLDSAFVVLQKIELVGSTGTKCEDADSAGTPDDADGCDLIEGGPVLVTLPLDGSVHRQFYITVDTGTFNAVRVQIHTPSGAADQQFLQDHPGYDSVSVRVTGTYNGTPYVYTTSATDLKALTLAAPLHVTEGDTVALTLRMNTAGWFVDKETEILIDPLTATGAGTNVEMVRQNVTGSFNGYPES